MSDQKKILIVDDVEANRFVLRNIISDMGYLPVLAENGIQTLKIMEHIKPNLILLDVAMPQMDGFELCGILKNDPLTREIPVIFISAFDSPDDITKGFSVGGEDYITKPFIHEVVQARIAVHLKIADMNNDLQNANRKLALSVQQQLKQMEQEKMAIEQQVKLQMQDAAYGTAPGYKVSWVSSESKRVDSQRLKKEQPDIFNRYSKNVSSRRFTIIHAA